MTITESAWCDEAARYLATTLRGVPCWRADDYRLELERNPDAKLYRIAEGDKLVGFVVLRIERMTGGAEGVLLAAAGRLAGARLYGQVLPAIEALFTGVNSLRADPCRAGAVRELARAGYIVTHVTMRKIPAARPRGDDMLEALARAGADELGGPSIQARPGRLHKGGSSTSTSAQTTTNTDRRVVADNGAFALSAGDVTGSTITLTDLGAIDKAFTFAAANDQQTGKNISNTLAFAKDIFDQGLTVLDKAGQQIQQQTELVAKAYDTAQGAGDQKTILAAAGLAAVAIVAIKVWGK